MHGLQTIVRNNDDASLAGLATAQPHLHGAPRSEHFDHNIPWSYRDGVARIHVHAKTKVSDAIKLTRHICAEHGVRTVIKRETYQ